MLAAPLSLELQKQSHLESPKSLLQYQTEEPLRESHWFLLRLPEQQKEQAKLAMLVLSHRGKLEKLAAMGADESAWQLIFCLRLAVLLHRTRDDRALPAWRVKLTPKGFHLDISGEWLAANPWTAAALNEEVSVWQRIGRELVLVKSRTVAKRTP